MTVENKINLENEALESISQQVNEGYYSGMFDLYNDETDSYHHVSWSLNVDIDYTG